MYLDIFSKHKKLEACSQIHWVDISVSAQLKQAESKGVRTGKLPICSTQGSDFQGSNIFQQRERGHVGGNN